MGFLSGLLGGFLGYGCQVFSNAIQKVPLSRQPWLHVTYFTIGCIIGDYYPKAERRLVDDINVMRAEKGLLPLVGTAAWIRYQPSDSTEEDGEIGGSSSSSVVRSTR